MNVGFAYVPKYTVLNIKASPLIEEYNQSAALLAVSVTEL